MSNPTYSTPQKSNPQNSFTTTSIEATLTIPTQYNFLKTQSGQKTHLFSRSEVSTLLQVSMLASELDVVLSLVYESLDRVNLCNSYRDNIESSSGVYLRALLPLLSVHSETAEGALKHVTSENFGIHQILNELDACAVELKKFSEQNWNMAEQLSYMMPNQSHLLSKEKRVIAELEDTVAERIFHLKDLSSLDCDDDDNNFGPMEDYCNDLFSRIGMSTDGKDSHNTGQSEMEVDHTSSQINAAQALALLGGKSK